MTAYRFGRFELLPSSHELLIDGKPAPIGARALDVLQVLLDGRDRVVTKDELLARAWPGLVVEENNLQVQVSALRKVLGASAIATVPGRGYRLAIESATPTASATTSGHSIPRLPGALIGRDRDLARVCELMAQHQLVTVTGSGGVGKTRLAIEAAATSGSGRAWLVDLAALADPLQVPQTVATALGIVVPATQSPQDVLRQALRNEQVLIVLDNCEHLLDAVAPLLEALLAAASGVRVLATSREPIGIAGEQVFRLPSLGVPGTEETPPEAALRFGAVQLFVERVRAADPDFVLGDDDVARVAAICRRLDGIPLALEMAAARVPMLGVASLAQRLDERFRVLTIGRRTALPRQRTLHATLAWSFSLLTPQERTVFRRLGVLAGAFTLEAAARVASDDDLDEFAVVDLVASLGAKSLVVAETDAGTVRYRLLESARAYAQERLAEAGETAGTACRHAAFMRAVFARCRDDWSRLSDPAFLASYERWLDDLRLAVDSSFGPGGDCQTGIALVGMSGPLWLLLSLYGEVDRWLGIALAALTPQTPPLLEADLRLTEAHVLAPRGSPRAHSAARRAAELYRGSGDVLREGLAQFTLAGALLNLRGEGAEAELDAAIPLLEAAHRPRLAALAQNVRATLAALRGSKAEAATERERAIEMWRIAGVDSQVLNLRAVFADFYWANGELDRGIAIAREMLAELRASRFANRVTITNLVANLYGMLVERGDLAEARTVGREVITDLRDLELVAGWGEHFALSASKAGSPHEAARILGWCEALRAHQNLEAQTNEARARASVLALLSAALVPADLAHLLAEGAALDEESGYELLARACRD